MYQEKKNSRSHMWEYKVYRVCLLGMMGLVLAALVTTTGLAPIAYASGPGGNVSDPVVKAVDIAKPAVVRIITEVIGHLTVTFTGGKSVTFPQTAQQGVNGYPLGLSGTGAFISAHGDILTADHVINPVQDDKQAMDQYLDQTAAPDIANYINQHSQQRVTADQVTQELIAGQLPSNPQYDKALSRVFLSTDYSGSITATALRDLPASQYADVDQIKASSPFTLFDTAIIHVTGMDNMPMLQLGDSSTVQEQDQLRIIGFPGNGDVNTRANDLLTSSINIINVSSIKTLPGGGPLIQVGGNVEQGDSGGPALDNNGHVVGIVSFGSASGGSTSFLRASISAKQMMQQAGVDTTPSAFQVAWSKAFNDYASTTPGHWHQSTSEFQKLASQYPLFKAVSPFLQYATQQAQTETQTGGNGTTTGSTTSPTGSGSGGLNPIYLIIGGLLVLVVIVFGGSVAISRSRRKSAQPGMAVASQASYGAPGAGMVPQAGYGTPGAAPYFGPPNQAFPTMPATPPAQPGLPSFAPVPQTPSYPGQAAYPQVARPQAPSPAPQPAFLPQQSSTVSQPGFRPQQPSPVPQPGFHPQQSAPQAPFGGGMSAFGAPPVPVAAPNPQPAVPQASDSTIVARSGSSSGSSVSQWRIWPCGHTNRFDASFCGTCGESAPPAQLVRRLEQ